MNIQLQCSGEVLYVILYFDVIYRSHSFADIKMI